MKTAPKKIFIILGLILTAAVIAGISFGSVAIPLKEITLAENRPIILLRFSRVVLAVFVGAGLASSGAALQAVLRNPLAEPYLLGASSGAGLGAVSGLLLGLSTVYLPLAGFLGALFSIVLVYNLAKESGRIPVQSLILSGVVIAIAFTGLTVFLISSASREAVHGVLWWLLGSLQVYDPWLLTVCGVVVILGAGAIFFLSQDLNAISLGEEEALHLGIEIEKVKKILFFVTSVVTGAIVSVSGMIGFAGLIVPHMMRLLVGPNHKKLIPACCLAGAAFLVVCDVFSRSIMAPTEIPIGVITSLVGAPVFILLLKRRQKVK